MRGRRTRGLPAVLKIIIGLIIAGFAVWTGLVAFVVVREMTVRPSRPEDTQAIIVLGAQVKEDGTLSLQLQWRLDKALEIWRQYPQPIVVCGAQGANEPVTEAAAMRQYLMENGISDADILVEDQSFNTRQNLKNARALLSEGTDRVLIVTSIYHLPRAMALAEDAGFAPSGAGSPVKWIYWPKNHYREALAWVKYWMQKWGILSY